LLVVIEYDLDVLGLLAVGRLATGGLKCQ